MLSYQSAIDRMGGRKITVFFEGGNKFFLFLHKISTLLIVRELASKRQSMDEARVLNCILLPYLGLNFRMDQESPKRPISVTRKKIFVI